MNDEPTTEVTDVAPSQAPDVDTDTDALVEDVLVEQVSIDGMCGVY